MQVCDVESTGCVEGRKGQPRVTTKMERQRRLLYIRVATYQDKKVPSLFSDNKPIFTVIQDKSVGNKASDEATELYSFVNSFCSGVPFANHKTFENLAAIQRTLHTILALVSAVCLGGVSGKRDLLAVGGLGTS